MNDNEKVTPISHDCKRLLLKVLTSGYITDEQKSTLANFFDIEQTQLVYISSRDNLDEVQRIYEEISEEARRKGIMPSDMVKLDKK